MRYYGGMSKIPISDPSQKARDWMGMASGTYSQMQTGSKTETKGPGHTAGGAMMGMASGAATGAMVGSAVPGIGTAVGAVVGAGFGLASYMFS